MLLIYLYSVLFQAEPRNKQGTFVVEKGRELEEQHRDTPVQVNTDRKSEHMFIKNSEDSLYGLFFS